MRERNESLSGCCEKSDRFYRSWVPVDWTLMLMNSHLTTLLYLSDLEDRGAP